MKIYIAGPMTGIEEYNHPAFNQKADDLIQEGHTVLNPTVFPDGLEHHEYIHMCLAMIDVSDAVYFLPDWRGSKGAQLEYLHALKTGKVLLPEGVEDDGRL